MAIEIVDFPIISMVIFQFDMLNYQRVNMYIHILVGGIPTPLKNHGVSNSWDDDIPNIRVEVQFISRSSRDSVNHRTIAGGFSSSVTDYRMVNSFITIIKSIIIVIIIIIYYDY